MIFGRYENSILSKKQNTVLLQPVIGADNVNKQQRADWCTVGKVSDRKTVPGLHIS